VLGHDRAQALRDVGEGVVPGGLFEAVVAPDERRRQAVGRAHEPVREAPLHAGVAAVDRRAPVRAHGGDLVAGEVNVQRAAHPAVAAGGRRDALHRRRPDGQAGLEQRARRARVDAAAAGHARRVPPGLPRSRRHEGLETAADEAQGERSLHLVAHAHAAPAGDAQVAVELDVGMGLVDAALVVRAGEAPRLDAVGLERGDQLAAVGGQLECPLGQLGCQQAEHAAHVREGIGIPRAHPVAVRDRGRARGHGVPAPLHAHQAGTARAGGRRALVEAQGGQLGAGRAHGVEYGGPGLDLDRAPVDLDPHAAPSSRA
jgi:hypothetical protein